MAGISRFGVLARMNGISDEIGIDFATPEAAAEYARKIADKEEAERLGYDAPAEWAYAVDEHGLAVS